MKKLLYLLPLFFACNDLQTQLPDPDVEDVPFVHCVLYTDQDRIIASVYHSIPAYGEAEEVYWREPDPITNAQVVISDGSDQIALTYSAFEEHYWVNAPLFVSEGKTYELRVVVDGKELTSTCTVPANPVTDIELEPDSIRVEFGWTELLFRARFKDETPVGHYYQMDGKYGYEPGLLGPIEFNNGLLLLSDKGRDGQWVEETGLTYNEYYHGTIFAELNVASLSRDLYLYNQSMSIYASGFYEEDNPFIEPSILHHNIKGGLGIFGAINNRHREYEF